MSKYDYLIGTKVNRWSVIEKSQTNKYRFKCVCDCGAEKDVKPDSLARGTSKSCGCLQKEINVARITKHGHATNVKPRTTEYSRWQNIIARCTNPKNTYYHNYGGRGITVCERWLTFENFLEDMGLCPTKHHQIDRIDNTKGYYPDNCEWVCMKDQSVNKRKRHDNTSGVPGVAFRKDTKKWSAYLNYDGKHYTFGCYNSFEDAVVARKDGEKQIIGKVIKR